MSQFSIRCSLQIEPIGDRVMKSHASGCARLPGGYAMVWWDHLVHSRAQDSNNNREVAGGTNLLEFKIDYKQSRSDLHGI